MIDLQTLATYMLVVLGLFLIPGPAVLLTIARATVDGRRVGVATGLGIATGDFVHTCMAALGLSALMMTSALAFQIVKYLGVAYLLFLAFQAFRERPADFATPNVASISAARAYRQAVLAEMLNPKTALFFLSFLPQFIHSEQGEPVVQLATLGLIFVAMSAVYTSLIATGAGTLRAWLARHPSVARAQGKVVAAVYLLLGVRLALQER